VVGILPDPSRSVHIRVTILKPIAFCAGALSCALNERAGMLDASLTLVSLWVIGIDGGGEGGGYAEVKPER